MNYLKEILHRYSPIFAALASLRLRSGHALREIFRVSVAALPRWVSVVNQVLPLWLRLGGAVLVDRVRSSVSG